MVRRILKEAIKGLGNRSIRIPVFGPCPRCGHSLFLVETPFGKFIVCSNPACNYFSRVKG